MTSKSKRPPATKPAAATTAEPATGPHAVPGLVGAAHREMRRGTRRRQIEEALRHPSERALGESD